MKNALIVALAAAAVACSESGPEPLSPEVEALVATAPEWTSAGITRDLPVDETRRQEIENRLEALHASMLEMHRGHEAARELDGEDRADRLAQLRVQAASLHERHDALWTGLDPAVAEELATRLHARLGTRYDGAEGALHKRMRSLNVPGHDADEGSIHERMRRLHGHAAPGSSF